MTGLRPAPEPTIVLGALLGLVGYVSPWFRRGDGYSWSFSGWAYASLSTGGSWTLITFLWSRWPWSPGSGRGPRAARP